MQSMPNLGGSGGMHGKLVSCRIDCVDMNYITQLKIQFMNIIMYQLRLVSMQSAKEINLCFIHQYIHISSIMRLIVGLRQYRGVSHGAMVPVI